MSAGVDLLLRVVGEQLAAAACERCGRSLAGARLALLEQAPESIVVGVSCAACGSAARFRVEPDSGDGVARLR